MAKFLAVYPSTTVIVSLLYLALCSANYEFEEQTFETISVDIEEHYFYKMNHQERVDLCTSAKNHAKLNGMGPDDFVSVPSVRLYMTTYSHGYKEIIVAIQCPTLPPAYLKRGDSDKKIKIMIRTNKFENEPYEFSPRVISDAVKTYFYVPENEQIKRELEEHDLHKMNLVDRSDICLAAKKMIPQYPLPSPPTASVHRAKILEIHYEGGRPRQRHIALQCPSALYNVFICAGDSPYKMEVILIKEDPSMEIGRDSLVFKNSSQQESSIQL